MYAATRIFTSNLTEKLAQRFFNLVLLPRVRDDIAEYKKLNFHLYQALRKALFKPGAFFKGFLLPLCEVRENKLSNFYTNQSIFISWHVEWHVYIERSYYSRIGDRPLLHSCVAFSSSNSQVVWDAIQRRQLDISSDFLREEICVTVPRSGCCFPSLH